MRNVAVTKQGRQAFTAIAALWTATLSNTDLVAKAANLDATRRRLERVSLLLGRMERAQLKTGAA